MPSDNLDLQTRRRRLRVYQWEIARELGLGTRQAYISEFETGKRETFPNGLGRADYERVLDQIEAQRGAAA